jgi:hypothetical protein
VEPDLNPGCNLGAGTHDQSGHLSCDLHVGSFFYSLRDVDLVS